MEKNDIRFHFKVKPDTAKLTLLNHMRNHTEQSDIDCSICVKAKATKNMTKKVLNANRQKPIECVICGKRFRDNIAMNVHMRMDHNHDDNFFLLSSGEDEDSDEMSSDGEMTPDNTGMNERSEKNVKGTSTNGASEIPTKRKEPIKRLKSTFNRVGRCDCEIINWINGGSSQKHSSSCASHGEEDMETNMNMEDKFKDDCNESLHGITTNDQQNSFLKKKVNRKPMERSPTSEKMVCPICNEAFDMKNHFLHHMITHCHDKSTSSERQSNSPSTKTKFKCSACHKDFNTNLELQEHMELHPSKEQFLSKDPKKSQQYKQMSERKQKTATSNCNCNPHLNRKLRMAMNACENHFRCQICNKSFTGKENFRRHFELHTKQSPAQCPICMKIILYRANLKRHLRTHINKKCSICYRNFSNENYFERHVKLHKRSHLNVKSKLQQSSTLHSEFEGQTSKPDTQFSQSKHSSGKEVYRCRICTKVYSSKGRLQTHLKKHMDIDTSDSDS